METLAGRRRVTVEISLAGRVSQSLFRNVLNSVFLLVMCCFEAFSASLSIFCSIFALQRVLYGCGKI